VYVFTRIRAHPHSDSLVQGTMNRVTQAALVIMNTAPEITLKNLYDHVM